MTATSKYFDAMHFASRSHCKQSLVGVGLIDTVCPAEGIIATFNQLPDSKKLVIMPLADHGGDHHVYSEEFSKFLEGVKE